MQRPGVSPFFKKEEAICLVICEGGLMVNYPLSLLP
jgi:hypothetical protein